MTNPTNLAVKPPKSDERTQNPWSYRTQNPQNEPNRPCRETQNRKNEPTAPGGRPHYQYLPRNRRNEPNWEENTPNSDPQVRVDCDIALGGVYRERRPRCQRSPDQSRRNARINWRMSG